FSKGYFGFDILGAIPFHRPTKWVQYNIGFTNFDWGSDLGDDSGNAINGIKTRTNNSIASSHILALNYDHWHYSVVARYWHDGGQWNDDAELNFGNGNFNVRSTGWGGYLVVGYNF
ncbi:outer membrane protein OmpK, partial [Escherichia coli]